VENWKSDGKETDVRMTMNWKSIVEPLLTWYQFHARRLPWREAPSPYRIWIAEIMLQQTRIETVIPYYQRFLQALPTIADLAAVPEDRLLKLWEGLGYYRRARYLQTAARMIMTRFNGQFPEPYDEIRSLPGIGEYTAGAIASIAFGQPTPALDGNVLRVICRLTGDRRDIADRKTRDDLRNRLQQIYPPGRSGDFTQSLMELGEVICVPNGAPECAVCPLAEWCMARAAGTILEIPVKTPPKARKIEQKTVLLIRCGGRIAVRQRTGQGLLAGLWEFPMLDGWPTEDAVRAWLEKAGIQVKSLQATIAARHVFSHLEWEMKGFLVEGTGRPAAFTWVSCAQLKDELALPTALKAFRQLL